MFVLYTTLKLPVGVYAVHSTAIICDTECTGGCLCCTALPLPVRLSIQVDVYSVHSIEITCDAEHTGECLCCT